MDTVELLGEYLCTLCGVCVCVCVCVCTLCGVCAPFAACVCARVCMRGEGLGFGNRVTVRV